MADQQKIKQTQTEVYRHDGRRWPALVLLLLAALIIATLVTLAGRWIYREITNSEAGRSSDTADFGTQQSQQGLVPEGEGQTGGETVEGSDEDSPAVESQPGNSETPATGDKALPRTGG